MFFRYKETDVFYERKRGEGTPVLLLHGWGCSHKTTQPVFDFYKGLGREVITLDFPPFGESEKPRSPFSLDDYALMTLMLLGLLGINEVEIFAHSFGARVTALMNKSVQIKRLIITGGAGIKPRKTLKKSWAIFRYKLRKKLRLSTEKFGSPDYKMLDENMRKTFVSVVNRHTESELSEITAPTLLIWGEKDEETPLYMAKKMQKLIKSSRLVVMKNCAHFAFLEDRRAFFAILGAFTESNL